jgi:putative oxidoreductase
MPGDEAMSNVTRTTARSLSGPFDQATHYAPAAGRALMSVIFLLSGVMKFMNWQQTLAMLESKGMPLAPALLAAAATLEVLGGLALLVGFQARIAALILFLYLIPTTLVFHNFWAHSGEAQMNQMLHSLENLTIMGGLLVVVGWGAGPLSVDNPSGRRP